MGQEFPQNYGKLVFGLPLSTREEFDPSSESIHGLLSGGSHQREEPEEEDEPMDDPYTRPSRHSTARGSSHRERNLHQEALNRERNLETDGGRIIDHHQEAQVQGSIFHQRKLDLMQKKNKILTSRQKIMFKRKLHFGSLKINLKVIIFQVELPLQYLHQTLGSCMKLVSFAQDCLMEVSNITPVVNVLSVYANGDISFADQRLILRHQDIGRPAWEKLPWTGHLCYLFTRAWEV